ncbi:MAG: cyclic nucleotide-binding domain-containing protein [Desulfobacteraceae bacterium]|nr:cyclic nucleotide-binding domain-containing protein [Desulfobacteraceae bacterium]
MIESKYLKNDIKNIQKLMVIPALRNFEIESLGRLVSLSKIRRYEDGETIILEGDNDPWLFFLLAGGIRVEKDGVEISTTSQMGEMFGEMRLLDNQGRSANVFAVGKTMCLAVNTQATEKMGSNDRSANFLLLLYKVFAEYVSMRLRLANEELVKLRSETAASKSR